MILCEHFKCISSAHFVYSTHVLSPLRIVIFNTNTTPSKPAVTRQKTATHSACSEVTVLVFVRFGFTENFHDFRKTTIRIQKKKPPPP